MAALPHWQAKYITKYNQQVPGETQAELHAVQERQEVLLQNNIDFCTIKHLQRTEDWEKQRRKGWREQQEVQVTHSAKFKKVQALLFDINECRTCGYCDSPCCNWRAGAAGASSKEEGYVSRCGHYLCSGKSKQL